MGGAAWHCRRSCVGIVGRVAMTLNDVVIELHQSQLCQRWAVTRFDGVVASSNGNGDGGGRPSMGTDMQRRGWSRSILVVVDSGRARILF
ncbi:hypothetical protein L484_021137 [Morus notabilis]|uniref:Uncharacterized protein n=1 Tax=Morus notabilis TaxID=981085 RepID=W9RCG8_9ROSA|nr:hypothetical protein L484_021137 [Morus notabilis]